jgi:hypothetical protein
MASEPARAEAVDFCTRLALRQAVARVRLARATLQSGEVASLRVGDPSQGPRHLLRFA